MSQFCVSFSLRIPDLSAKSAENKGLCGALPSSPLSAPGMLALGRSCGFSCCSSPGRCSTLMGHSTVQTAHLRPKLSPAAHQHCCFPEAEAEKTAAQGPVSRLLGCKMLGNVLCSE